VFSWIYWFPNWALLAFIGVLAVGFCWGSIFALRPVMDRLFGDDHEQRNSLVELVLTGTGLFYGLLLGLIAAATYTTYSNAEGTVESESTTVAALYRDVSSYPEPLRDELRADLERYVDAVIEEEWPIQQQGDVPTKSIGRITEFQRKLTTFEPRTPGQEVLHAEAFSQFNKFIEDRRARLNSVSASLPSALWWVLSVGALINLLLMSMLAVRNLAAHLVISGLFAVFVAMMIFLIVAMDNPFLGEFSVAPTSFERLRANLFGN
jgi:hypothetical protein